MSLGRVNVLKFGMCFLLGLCHLLVLDYLVFGDSWGVLWYVLEGLLSIWLGQGSNAQFWLKLCCLCQVQVLYICLSGHHLGYYHLLQFHSVCWGWGIWRGLSVFVTNSDFHLWVHFVLPFWSDFQLIHPLGNFKWKIWIGIVYHHLWVC